jgi:hypothetical protein
MCGGGTLVCRPHAGTAEELYAAGASYTDRCDERQPVSGVGSLALALLALLLAPLALLALLP